MRRVLLLPAPVLCLALATTVPGTAPGEAERADFHAAGQEPGWSLDVFEGRHIRFLYDYGAREVRTPAPPATVEDEGVVVYRAVTESAELRVAIEPHPCSDAMSGEPFESTVTVTLDGETFHGCGGPLPEPRGPATDE